MLLGRGPETARLGELISEAAGGRGGGNQSLAQGSVPTGVALEAVVAALQ